MLTTEPADHCRHLGFWGRVTRKAVSANNISYFIVLSLFAFFRTFREIQGRGALPRVHDRLFIGFSVMHEYRVF